MRTLGKLSTVSTLMTVSAMVVALSGLPTTASAITYNAGADLVAFEAINSGPTAAVNGTWSYGNSPNVLPGYTFTLYPAVEHTDSFLTPAFQGWNEPGGGDVPATTVNVTGVGVSPCCGIDPIDPGQMFMHPDFPGGGARDLAIVRWTSPGDGTLSLAANWVQKHFNPQEVDLVYNGTTSLFTGLATTGLGTSFFLPSFTVHAGDTFDFAVAPNPGSGSGGGSTGFNAILDLVIPEPSTLALLGLGGLGLWLRRRKA